jgi:putative FmdB family regulatory protein
MPIYEYRAADPKRGCRHCAGGFEAIQRISDARLEACPECGGKVVRVISAPSLGSSKSSLDDRAKAAGFTKLKRLGKGEYEKQY